MNKHCTRCNKDKDVLLFSKESSRCRLCKSKIAKIWRLTHPERAKLSRERWAKNHLDEMRAYKRRWNKANPEKNASLKRAYKDKNREKISAYNKKWQKNNKGKTNYYTRKYQADKLQRTPSWLTIDQFKKIEQFYVNCPNGYHVDHIIPLRGKNISGLHVPENLQYLPAYENVKKSNKFKKGT